MMRYPEPTAKQLKYQIEYWKKSLPSVVYCRELLEVVAPTWGSTGRVRKEEESIRWYIRYLEKTYQTKFGD